jgi:hypothetical protein
MKCSGIIASLLLFLVSLFFTSSLSQAEQIIPRTTINPIVLNSFVDIVPNRSSGGTNWLALDSYEEGWYEPAHDDIHWELVDFTDSGINASNYYRFPTHYIFHPDRYVTPVYYRGHVPWDQGFEHGNPVKRVIVKVCANGDFTLYLNGEFVGSESDGLVGPLRIYDVTSKWQTGSIGDNIFAAEVSYTDLPSASLYVIIRVYFTGS